MRRPDVGASPAVAAHFVLLNLIISAAVGGGILKRPKGNSSAELECLEGHQHTHTVWLLISTGLYGDCCDLDFRQYGLFLFFAFAQYDLTSFTTIIQTSPKINWSVVRVSSGGEEGGSGKCNSDLLYAHGVPFATV